MNDDLFDLGILMFLFIVIGGALGSLIDQVSSVFNQTPFPVLRWPVWLLLLSGVGYFFYILLGNASEDLKLPPITWQVATMSCIGTAVLFLLI